MFKASYLSVVCRLIVLILALVAQAANAQTGPEVDLAAAQALYRGDATDDAAMAEIAALLERIVAEHPASDLAVSILLHDTVGGIDVALVYDRAHVPDTAAAPERPQDPAEAIALCLDNLIDADRSVAVDVEADVGSGGALTGLPRMTSPEIPGAEARLLYLGVVGALDVCAPFPAELSGRTVVVTVPDAGAVTLVAGNGEPSAPETSEPDEVTASPSDKPISPVLLGLPAAELEDAAEPDETALALEPQDYRDIQARLAVLQFDPNGIDGKPGKGTRAAIRSWQSSRGVSPTGFLNAGQLASLRAQSEQPLQLWLQDEANEKLYNPPPPIEVGPANLSGQWRFTTSCGSRSRVGRQKITGVFAIAHSGGGRYSGRIQNSQGLRGTVNGRIANRRLNAEVNWGLFLGRVQVSGRIADYELAMSGSDSNGCAFAARKQ